MKKLEIKLHVPDVWERLHDAVSEIIELSKTHPAITDDFDPETDEQNFWDFHNKIDDIFDKHKIKVVDK